MYFKRVDRLDLPKSAQIKLLQEWESNLLPQTSRGISVTQYCPTQILQQEIYAYCQSFLDLVPDVPKMFIKKIHSKYSRIVPHTDKAQTASITCVINTDAIVDTVWYESVTEFEHLYQNPDLKYKNIKGIDSLPDSHTTVVASTKLKPWEMTLFDHNSFHSVEDFVPDMERVLFSIGFLNISEHDLENIYDQWENTK